MEENIIREHIKLKELITLFIKHKKFLFYFVGIFTIIIFLYTLICPREYEAYTSILPPEKSNTPGISSMLSSFAGGALSLANIDQSAKLCFIQKC